MSDDTPRYELYVCPLCGAYDTMRFDCPNVLDHPHDRVTEAKRVWVAPVKRKKAKA